MRKTSNVNIQNKKARFDYEWLETYMAGIILTGTEIKSIREGKASLVDSYCYVDDGGLWLKNSYIAPYDNGGYANHDERRLRKLLLTKKEVASLAKGSQTPGNTIIPTKMFINEKGLCKVNVALCRGRKDYDKRHLLKEHDAEREMDAVKKGY